jgi:hypothetical protein
MAFWRKKTEKPKSVLGIALLMFDDIMKSSLNNIFNLIKSGKNINPRSADKVISSCFIVFDTILYNISMENFKTDYRSDKIRNNLEEMINKIKSFLENLKINGFKTDLSDNNALNFFSELAESRNSIRKKMKDIEGDYT